MNLTNCSKMIGKEFETNNYGKCFIIDHKGHKDVLVMFYSPLYITKCEMGNLRKGEVCNPFYPSVYGKGYIGIGKYNSKEHKSVYNLWKGVLQRVYTTRHASYINTCVCEEWLCFQNFAKWCESQEFFNAKDENGRSYQLDKDILIKGNKMYSPETCCFVPREINSSFIKYNMEGKVYDLPLGVKAETPKKVGNLRYSAKLSLGGGKRKYLGSFSSSEEAFSAYKEAKESHIKEVAEKWKGKIDEKVYQTLISWELVE